MSNSCKRIIVCFVTLTLISMLCLGCGGGKGPEVPTIVIGELTDLTGVAAPSLIPIHKIIEDLASYYNEEGLIPGAKIRVVSYDTKMDAGRFLAGWDWLIERGAKIVVVGLPVAAMTLKDFAERQKVPIISLGAARELAEPPGWVFAPNCLPSDEMRTELKWISENYWDYTEAIPKIGYIGWDYPAEEEVANAMKRYCQDHPDKFAWGGSHLAPVNTIIWGGEVALAKDCDYVCGPTANIATANLGVAIQQRGYSTKFIGTSSMAANVDLLAKICGWGFLDGSLSPSICLWWNVPAPVVDLVKSLIDRYRRAEADDIMHSGSSYLGVFNNMRSTLEIVAAAVKEMGAENFDGQAFYNAALNYKTNWEGYPQWGFSETERTLIKDIQIYEWSAEAQDLVRMSDWLPIVTE
jgi:hypothetical protein